jgi:hypothetical protein
LIPIIGLFRRKLVKAGVFFIPLHEIAQKEFTIFYIAAK